jgi:hypothetical protein
MNMELLDCHKENSRLSFNNEVKNLEFVEIIGDMDINAYTNPKTREQHLLDIGKKLLVNIIYKENKKTLIESKEP